MDGTFADQAMERIFGAPKPLIGVVHLLALPGSPAFDRGAGMRPIVEAARRTGADAIHPGYGFLSENADFAAMVEEHGLVFIGPTPEHIRMMGDKVVAKQTARALGIPCVPGSDGPVQDLDAAIAAAKA